MQERGTGDSGKDKDLKALLEDYERALILSTLAATGGHQRRAAAALGLLPSTLSEKMKRLGIRRQPPPSAGGPRSAPSSGEAEGAAEEQHDGSHA